MYLFRCAGRYEEKKASFDFDYCFWSHEPDSERYISQEKLFEMAGRDLLKDFLQGMLAFHSFPSAAFSLLCFCLYLLLLLLL